MTTVKIRHENDATARFLANVPFADLDSVIPTIKSWGITTDDSDYPDLLGQFVYREGGAYFEIVICAAGDES